MRRLALAAALSAFAVCHSHAGGILRYLGASDLRKDSPELRKKESEELEKQVSELRGMAGELRPLYEELEALGLEYDVSSDPVSVAARRKALLDRIDPLKIRFGKAWDAYRVAAQRGEGRSYVRMARDAVVKGSMSADSFLDANMHEEAQKEFRRLYHDFSARYTSDGLRYKAFMEQVRRRRRIIRIACGTGLLLLLGGCLAYRRVRRGPKPVPKPLPEPAPAPAGIGSVLAGHIRLGPVIGKGGMGVVHEAEDLSLGRKVAVKKMHDVLAKGGREIGKFIQEARLVAKLRHPYIIEIYSVLQEAGGVYLVFEHVKGVSLHSYLRGKGRMDMKLVLSVLRQAASALDYAHSKRIIHRDLKPANIMVMAQGMIKVMDFGIAHQAKKTVSRLTRAGVWGTPPYMAPEQELGQACRESDLFSLGACCYEMLTGKAPYAGPNYLAQKQNMIFDPPSKLVPALPEAADNFMRRALAPDPRERFHSGKEFIAELEDISRA